MFIKQSDPSKHSSGNVTVGHNCGEHGGLTCDASLLDGGVLFAKANAKAKATVNAKAEAKARPLGNAMARLIITEMLVGGILEISLELDCANDAIFKATRRPLTTCLFNIKSLHPHDSPAGTCVP